MLPSAKERKKSIHNFMNCYSNLCQVQNTIPIPGIKVNLPNKVLDFIGDRIKLDDWRPILKALSCDRSLHYVAIRSKQTKINVLESVDSEEKARQVTKSPVFFTNFVLLGLADSISKCLINSSSLTCLQIERIPLDNKLITLITEGLHQTTTLQHLSLNYCRIGDEGCNILCRIVRYRCNLVSLNLSGCELTEVGATYIAETIKIQKLNRYGESWKQSLRYRPVNPEIMPGLRRVTLNNNPRLRDIGLISIIETLIDDLWIKAVDFQNCGITSVGAERVLELIKENKYLSIIDIRANNNVIPAMVTDIMALLAENNVDEIPAYHWLQEETGSYKRTTTANSGPYQQYSQTTVYSTGINCRPTSTGTNPSVRHSKSLPVKRSNVTIGSSIIPGCPRRYVVSQLSKRVKPVIKHAATRFNENIQERELDSLRRQLVEETTQRIAAEEKLKDLQQLHNNADNYVYVEKSVMQAVTQICEDFMAMIIANKHPQCFDMALKLSKLMNNSELDNNMIAAMLNKIENCNNEAEFSANINFEQSPKDDLSDISLNLETHSSTSPYSADSSNSYEDQSSQEDSDIKAKLIFQSLLSTRRSQKRINRP